MIKPENFYSENENPAFIAKKKMWNEISRKLKKHERVPLLNIDYRSFAFGFGSAFAAALIIIGFISVFSRLTYKDEPAYVKLNNAYSRTIDEFEKSMPALVNAGYQSYNLDDKIKSKRANLLSIDEGIRAIKSDAGSGDFSPIKQSRLLELYKMKLAILEKIIVMEEHN